MIRRVQTIVDKPSLGAKVPIFGKSLKTFFSEGCIFKITLKTVVSIKGLLATDICYTYCNILILLPYFPAPVPAPLPCTRVWSAPIHLADSDLTYGRNI